MTDDAPVTRREFDRVIHEHERRLDGHDGLYTDLRETREELIRFTEALREAREQMTSGLTQSERCQERCAGYRDRFDQRIRVLERFRWQIAGVTGFLVAAPAWLSLIMLLR